MVNSDDFMSYRDEKVNSGRLIPAGLDFGARICLLIHDSSVNLHMKLSPVVPFLYPSIMLALSGPRNPGAVPWDWIRNIREGYLRLYSDCLLI